jgi:hypothetical protein
MNPLEFVIAIVAITTVGGIIRAKHGLPQVGSRRDRIRRGFGGFGSSRDDDQQPPNETADSVRLREEVKMLKERVQTLERIAVDKENSLAREIDSLRDR